MFSGLSRLRLLSVLLTLVLVAPPLGGRLSDRPAAPSAIIVDNAPGSPQSAPVAGIGYRTGPNSWAPTRRMRFARSGHTATLLPNGKVLVAGGGLRSAELYDPHTGTWTLTGSMHTAREGHTATLLNNGKVLVVGGQYNAGNSLVSAELYDPRSGRWTATGNLTGNLLPGWMGYTTTLLPNGQVLAVGGEDGPDQYPLNNAELYDPRTGRWTTAHGMIDARVGHTATLLPNGQVLVTGGCCDDLHDPLVVCGSGKVSCPSFVSAELFNPRSHTWKSTGSMRTSRYEHTATLLPNGKVLVVGGLDEAPGPYGPDQLASAELYDLKTGQWTATGNMMYARSGHTATLLRKGRVLVIGGSNMMYKVDPRTGNYYPTSAELYDPRTGRWKTTNSMTMSRVRYGYAATLLPSGQVLVTGGSDNSGALRSAELYTP